MQKRSKRPTTPTDSTPRSFWKVWVIGAVFTLVCACILWLPLYAQLPRGLNRDEAALGYNAYSIAETGRDEWGKFLPISITSFGDQKLPGYVYTLVPFIHFFGLETWVIRLPSLLSGFVVILSMGCISLLTARRLKLSDTHILIFSWLTMLFVAISPWQQHFSRVAYEAHLAMAFFTTAVAALFFAVETTNKKYQRTLFCISAVLLSLTLVIYHSYHIFTPLFVLAFVLLTRKSFASFDRIGILTSVSIGVFTVGLLFAGGIIQANAVKSRGISPFNEQKLLEQATQFRGVLPAPQIVNKLLFNKFSEGLVVVSQNYITTFSGQFFFVKGSNHGDHNPGNGNNTHLFIAPFLLMGMLAVWQFRKDTFVQLVAVWLFLAFLPSATTISPLHEVRIAAAFPILELLAAAGVTLVYFWLRSNYRIVFTLIMAVIITNSMLRSYLLYTLLSLDKSVDNTHYQVLARKLFEYKEKGFTVLTQSVSSSPYIWYLVENKIDPRVVQQEMQHYPATDEGFLHVYSLGTVMFETIEWETLSARPAEKPIVVILRPGEIQAAKASGLKMTSIEELRNPAGDLHYEIFQVNK